MLTRAPSWRKAICSTAFKRHVLARQGVFWCVLRDAVAPTSPLAQGGDAMDDTTNVTDKKEPRARFFHSRDMDTRPKFYCARCGDRPRLCISFTRTPLVAEGPVCHTCYQRAWRANRRREPEPIACASCGESFKPARSDARFCSDRCRQRAHRAAPPPSSQPSDRGGDIDGKREQRGAGDDQR